MKIIIFSLSAALLLTAGRAQAHQYDQAFQGELAFDAQQFARAAASVHRALRREHGAGHLTSSARRLARAARHYHRHLDDRASYRQRRGDFYDLEASFLDFRRDYRHERGIGSHRWDKAMRRLARSFHRLERKVLTRGHSSKKYRWHLGREDAPGAGHLKFAVVDRSP